ncbi:MAG: SDR family oxidoreductase [Chloroflexi bacterium]|nr:SDR family oxidoreductase [Chloroflexota bacterium]
MRRTVLVTGCSRGIGLAVAQTLLEEGARVIGAARSAPDLTHERFTFVPTDVADLASVEALSDTVSAALGDAALDGIVHCAVVQNPIGPLEDTDPLAWAEAIQIGLVGAYHVVRLLLPFVHRSADGRILLFAGGGAFGPRVRFSAYACAKAGVVRLAETLAEELAGSTVTINCVAPGFVPTPIHDQTLEAGPERAGPEYERVIRDVAHDDGSRLAQVVACVHHLLSPSARGLSGKTVAAQYDDWEHLTPFTVPGVMATDLWSARRVNQVPLDAAPTMPVDLPLRTSCSRPSSGQRRAPRDGRLRRFRASTNHG